MAVYVYGPLHPNPPWAFMAGNGDTFIFFITSIIIIIIIIIIITVLCLHHFFSFGNPALVVFEFVVSHPFVN